MPAPLTYVDAPTLAGSWPILPEASPFGASILPRTLRTRATIIGMKRETAAGYDVVGKTFRMDVDDQLNNPVSFTDPGPGYLTLDDVVSQINAAISPFTGFNVAFKDNGFLKLQSATAGEDSYVGLRTDSASGPQVFTELGLFSETHSQGGELEPTPQLDPDRQTIPHGQMLMAEGEGLDTRSINRMMLQVAINVDKLAAPWNKKQFATTTEATVVDPASGFTLSDTVYTGVITTPSVEQLTDVMVLLDDDGVEPVVEVLDELDTDSNTAVSTHAETGELLITTASAIFASSNVKDPVYVTITDAAMGTLSGKPLKVLRYFSTNQAAVRNVDDAGVVQYPSGSGLSMSLVQRDLVPVRVKGLWDSPSKTQRVEGVVTTILSSVSIDRVEKNNRVITTDAVDFTVSATIGDKVVISGHTASIPYSNNGTYRVSKIVDAKTLELVLENWGPAFLHGSGTALGSFNLQHDEAFYLNPYVELDGTVPAGSYRIVYMTSSTFEELTDDLTTFATPPLRYQQEADDTIHEAIRRILGPSATSYKDILYDDYRLSLEDLDFRMEKEHYTSGRHSSIRPNVIDMYPGIAGETVTVRADATDDITDLKLVLRNSSDAEIFSVTGIGSVRYSDRLISKTEGYGLYDSGAYGYMGLYETAVNDFAIAVYDDSSDLARYGGDSLLLNPWDRTAWLSPPYGTSAAPNLHVSIGGSESGDYRFGFMKGDGTNTAGFIRFGDNTGWRLHIGRASESGGGAINTTAAQGVLMTIKDNGFVGIGNTNPSQLFEVNGGYSLFTGAAENLIILTPSNDTDTAILYGTNAAGSTVNWRVMKSGMIGLGTAPSATVHAAKPSSTRSGIFATDTLDPAADFLIVDADDSTTRAALQVQGDGGLNECLFVSSGGYVGINNTNPTCRLSLGTVNGAKLAVHDDGTGMVGFGVQTATFQIGGYSAGASVRTVFGHWSGTHTFVEQMRLAHDTGFLGIGATPTDKLTTYNGNVLFTGPYSSSIYRSGFNFEPDTTVNANRRLRFIQNANTFSFQPWASSTDSASPGYIALAPSAGYVGIGTTTPATLLDVDGTIRSIAESVPTSGAGVEILYTSGNGVVQAYDRTGSAYDPMYVQGSELRFNATSFIVLGTAGSNRVRVDSLGNVGIATDSPQERLHVVGDMVRLASVETDATAKQSRIGQTHYTTAEEEMGLIYGYSGSTQNVVGIGGGTSLFNAATNVRIYAAVNTTTPTGTQIVEVDPNGIHVNASANYRFNTAESYTVAVAPWAAMFSAWSSLASAQYALYSTYKFVDVDYRVMPLVFPLHNLKTGHTINTISGRHYRWVAQQVTYTLYRRDITNITATIVGSVTSASSTTGWETLTSSDFSETVTADYIYWVEVSTTATTTGLNQQMFGGIEVSMTGQNLTLHTT